VYGIDIAFIKTAHILSFPVVPDKIRKEEINVMKILKKLLFAVAVMFCFSLAASAQNQEGKKPPPKDRPPVVPVEPKKPKDEKPKDDKENKEKKPGISFYLSENRIEINSI